MAFYGSAKRAAEKIRKRDKGLPSAAKAGLVFKYLCTGQRPEFFPSLLSHNGKDLPFD
jgi:hypothetical protein